MTFEKLIFRKTFGIVLNLLPTVVRCGKIADSESGSLSQRHGSADPDPHQNVMDQEHWPKVKLFEKVILRKSI